MAIETLPKYRKLNNNTNAPVFAKSRGPSRSCSPKRRGNDDTTCTTTPTTTPPPDKSGGGDVPPQKAGSGLNATSDSLNSNVSDRGTTGAGVTGSRKCQSSIAIESKGGDDDLPSSANNPGLLRYIHNAARNKLPQCFEGACVSVKQGAKSNWILGHSMSFSSVSPGGYKVLLSYADRSKAIGVPYFVMEAAPGGQMSCEVRVNPTRYTRAINFVQIADKELYSFESIFDAYLKNCTMSIIAVNKEFIALHILQAFTDQISLGAEIVTRSTIKELTSVSAAARWSNENLTISATLGNRGLDLCYARDIKPYLSMASMLEVGFAARRAVATLAYEWRASDWRVRGSLDSDGLVGVTFHKDLGGKRAQLACSISALLNHPNDKFRLGLDGRWLIGLKNLGGVNIVLVDLTKGELPLGSSSINIDDVGDREFLPVIQKVHSRQGAGN